MPIAVVGVLSATLIACGSDDGDSPAATTATAAPSVAATTAPAAGAVSVTTAGKTTEFASEAEAITSASTAAGFAVLPVKNLPADFAVTNIAITDAAAGSTSKTVKADLKGATGSAIVTQVNERQAVTGGTVIQTAYQREFYEIVKDGGVTYYLVTDDKTYTVVLADSKTMDREQSMELLRGFLAV